MEESERVLGEGADAADAQHVVVGSAPGRVKDQATLQHCLLTPQATHSPLRDWGPAASHQLRTGTGDSVPSHWLGTDWGLGTQSPARGLGLGTESSADARDCCGTGHWSPGLSHLKILILTAMSLDITTEL